MEVGGYAEVRALAEGRTYAAVAGGRRVVLKVLDSDVLLRGQLHPNIKERLARVRELAHGSVANLHAVERGEIGGETVPYAVWDFVDGVTFEDYALAEDRFLGEVLAVAGEVILAAEALHALGIVHGAIHARNAIVGPDGRVTLTHVSPLLYHDPARDAEAVVTMLRDVVARRGESDSEVAHVLAEAAERRWPLARLRAKLAAVGKGGEAGGGDARAEGRTIRRRAALGAACVAVIGGGVAYGVHRLARQNVGQSPAPPEAAPAQMEDRPGERVPDSDGGMP